MEALIAALLSALGLGGLGLAMVFVPGLRSAVLAGLGWVVDQVARHPWQAACLALALWGGYERWDGVRGWNRAAEWQAHHTKHLAADKASIAAAVQWRKRIEETAATVAELIREKTDAENRLNSALADSLRLRGPGRAAALCRPRGGAGLAAAAGGRLPDDRPGDAPVDPVPDDEPMAIVPWRDLVTRAEEADRNRTEALSWREWYARNKALIEDGKAELPVPAFGD